VRQVTLIGFPSGTLEQKFNWLHAQLRAIEAASRENDLVTIANAFTISGTYTTTRTLNVATATLSDLIAFVATFIDDCKKGGSTRTT
jgi:hypothetical protein